jgi:gentisate 1,2-dioxygenase
MARTLRRSGRRTLIQSSRAKSPQEKAIFHTVAGAGQSKVKRNFFDVSASDLVEIASFLETRLGDNLQRGSA